ncbi:DUF2887 domain-containing protein [Dolichospermum circinale]
MIETYYCTDKLFYHRFFSEIFLYLRQFDPPQPLALKLEFGV